MSKATRASFGETLAELGSQDPQIVVFDADLSCSTKSEKFAKAFPHRFFQMGIAEANMVGTAAGISFMGYVPFICSFGAFVATRYETIRMSVGYSQANVKIVGTHAGLGIGEDGYSQMGLEDLALLRALPNFTLLNPCDDLSTQACVKYAAQVEGPVYLRLTRQNLPAIYQSASEFEIGKARIVKPGKGMVLIGTGSTTSEALEAAKEIQDACVVDMSTIKPIDKAFIHQIASKHPAIVTIEDHHVVGGLGTAVAEALAELPSHAPLLPIGVETYGESGLGPELYEKYGISAHKIVERVRASLL